MARLLAPSVTVIRYPRQASESGHLPLGSFGTGKHQRQKRQSENKDPNSKSLSEKDASGRREQRVSTHAENRYGDDSLLAQDGKAGLDRRAGLCASLAPYVHQVYNRATSVPPFAAALAPTSETHAGRRGRNRWTPETAYAAIVASAVETGSFPTARQLVERPELPHYTTLRRLFGGAPLTRLQAMMDEEAES